MHMMVFDAWEANALEWTKAPWNNRRKANKKIVRIAVAIDAEVGKQKKM